MSAMTSSSTSISQQNAWSAGSEDKAQPAYTDIDKDRGEVGQEEGKNSEEGTRGCIRRY